MHCTTCGTDLSGQEIQTRETKYGTKQVIVCPNPECKDPKNSKYRTTRWLTSEECTTLVDRMETPKAEPMVNESSIIINKLDEILSIVRKDWPE